VYRIIESLDEPVDHPITEVSDESINDIEMIGTVICNHIVIGVFCMTGMFLSNIF
jgi:hypothetical protein